jgi:hemoglobin
MVEIPTMPDSDLYERLGAETAVEAAVVRFYRKVVADADLAPFFDGYDLREEMEKHIRFMITVFGGNVGGPPIDLRRVHQPLVRRGLGEKHVDGFIRILREVLAELEVEPADIDKVVASIEGSRQAVLGPRPGSAGGGGGDARSDMGFDQVVVNDGPTPRRFTPAEFLALPLSLRVTFVVQNKAQFYLGDQVISADTALADARKRRARLNRPATGRG